MFTIDCKYFTSSQHVNLSSSSKCYKKRIKFQRLNFKVGGQHNIFHWYIKFI